MYTQCSGLGHLDDLTHEVLIWADQEMKCQFLFISLWRHHYVKCHIHSRYDWSILKFGIYEFFGSINLLPTVETRSSGLPKWF